ncbi:hypothetical protein C8J57DRAFT_1555737 [Mycena rebaudengoi]|nr:hypothetical protein C8J57DRAFT_1555737 [Mycena rebaudengoi]
MLARTNLRLPKRHGRSLQCRFRMIMVFKLGLLRVSWQDLAYVRSMPPLSALRIWRLPVRAFHGHTSTSIPSTGTGVYFSVKLYHVWSSNLTSDTSLVQTLVDRAQDNVARLIDAMENSLSASNMSKTELEKLAFRGSVVFKAASFDMLTTAIPSPLNNTFGLKAVFDTVLSGQYKDDNYKLMVVLGALRAISREASVAWLHLVLQDGLDALATQGNQILAA